MRWLLMGFIKAWRRFISPLYGDVCRYYPTCSAYGLRAVEFHGALKGSWLTVRRICSCHPWAEGGVQFVPDTPEDAAWAAELRRRRAAADGAPEFVSSPAEPARTTGVPRP